MVATGAKVGFHGNKGLPRTRDSTMVARAVLNGMLIEKGEPLPHENYNGSFGTDCIEYRLPACFTKRSLFDDVIREMIEDKIEPIGYGTFHNIWNKNFENYKFHSTSAFSKCDICTIFKDQLQKERRKEPRDLIEKKTTLTSSRANVSAPCLLL